MIVVWKGIEVIEVNVENVMIVVIDMVVDLDEMVGVETEMAVVLITMAVSATATEKVDVVGDTAKRKSIDLI